MEHVSETFSQANLRQHGPVHLMQSTYTCFIRALLENTEKIYIIEKDNYCQKKIKEHNNFMKSDIMFIS